MTHPLLGVNIDHVATLRNARGAHYPDPVAAALICEAAGADGITLHLREDRRHIKDEDVYRMKTALKTRMNLEMAVTEEMLAIALDVLPHWVCLVPEKREELTTEGGLDVVHHAKLPDFIQKLQSAGIQVSLFIDPDEAQIEAAAKLGADAIELHTGTYAEAMGAQRDVELARIERSVRHAKAIAPDMIVNAGHGLNRDNVAPIAVIADIYELNIGHSIIADSVLMGLDEAVRQMKRAMHTASI